MTIGPRVIAVGWATVELDRAASELAALLVPGTAFADAMPSEHLGAWCRIGHVVRGAADADIIILLEPFTEGRLSATLARHDEGWRASWEAPDGSVAEATARALSVERPGPLGPERLILDGPVTGPHHRLLVAATIAT